MALTPSEVELIESLQRSHQARQMTDLLNERFREGEARIEHLGMAIPPNMRRFMVYVNWCDTYVTSHTDRQQVRSIILPGEESTDPQLRAIYDASNLDAKVPMFSDDAHTFGRAFWSVGANEDNASLPLVRAESPLEMCARVDLRRERMTAAARFYGDDETASGPTNVTLYLPDQTVWVEKRGGRWREVDRDVHNLGAVPVIMHLHRDRTGRWAGRPGISIIIPLVESVTRTMTNMQFGQEAAGIPRMYMTGVSQGDFVDASGKPIPQFEAYWNAIHTLQKEGAKVGQLTAADLKNFETAVTVNGKLAASLSKLPPDYFGITTTNPSGEGAIRAAEARLIRAVERLNDYQGTALGWAMALALRFATGEWPEGNRVKGDWFDPATPTVAQRMDAVSKAVAGGFLSREGAWDELGWSEARKAKERAYFEQEALDPVTRDLLRKVTDNVDDGA